MKEGRPCEKHLCVFVSHFQAVIQIRQAHFNNGLRRINLVCCPHSLCLMPSSQRKTKYNRLQILHNVLMSVLQQPYKHFHLSLKEENPLLQCNLVQACTRCPVGSRGAEALNS